MERKLLIVSINKDHRFLLNSLVEKKGFEIFAPESIEDSISLLKTSDFDKIVIDYTDYSFLMRILCNKIERRNNIHKCIFLNTEIDPVVAEKVIEHGGQLLDKPYDADQLLAIIKM